MTKEEFSILAKAMNTLFPDMNLLRDRDAMDIWYAMIGDIDYKTASQALQAHVNTSPYPPKVVDFRKFANRSTGVMNAEEAWALVTKALRNGIYGAEEEFAKLPKDVQKAVGSPVNLREWAQLEKDDVQGVQKSHFVRAYRVEAERTERDNLLPPSLRGGEHEAITDKNYTEGY